MEQKHNFISTLCIALSILLGFYNALNSTIYNLMAMVLLSVAANVFFQCDDYGVYKNAVKKILIIDIAAWIVIVFFAFIQNGDNPLRLATLAYLMYSSFVALYLSFAKCKIYLLKVAFYIIAGYLSYQCFVLGLLPDEILQFSAGGMMPSILLCISITIQLLDFRDNGRISIVPPIVVVFISTYSISRTALICSGIYFLVVLFFSTKSIKYQWARPLSLAVALCVISYYIIINWSLVSDTEIYKKFDYWGMDVSGRDGIIEAYLKEINGFTFITGRNVDNSHMIFGFGNTHNIFIQMHSQLGIFAIVFIVHLIKVMCYYLRNNIYVLLLLSILLIRGMSDSYLFFSVFDYAVFVFLLNKENIPNIKDTSVKFSIL